MDPLPWARIRWAWIALGALAGLLAFVSQWSLDDPTRSFSGFPDRERFLAYGLRADILRWAPLATLVVAAHLARTSPGVRGWSAARAGALAAGGGFVVFSGVGLASGVALRLPFIDSPSLYLAGVGDALDWWGFATGLVAASVLGVATMLLFAPKPPTPTPRA